MPSQTLDKNLRLLDFETESSASGLLFTNRDYRSDTNVSFDEILTLNLAQELKASAVYFRRIEGRSSVPQIFIYDNSDKSISPDDLNDIHKKLWSSGTVPLYYVFDKTEVRIFDCRKPVNKTTLKAEEFDTLSFISEIHFRYKTYSAGLFQNGSFWELPENKNRFNLNNSSYKKLIEGLKKIRDEFVKGQNEHICNKLIVLSIFVKYLEERKDKKENRVLPVGYFNKYDGATCFCDVLRNNKGIQFFKDLGKDINGKIFKLTKQEEDGITKLNQSKLADFLDARQDNYQYVLWNLYDFNYLPVELISRIYEEFIPKRKDITYTPAHLVDFMIDECMPINTHKDNIKLIDVSCGSGIFLVAAFKRIVQWWQKDQYKKTGEIKSPDIKSLKSILSSSIYGVDIEPEAVKLTIFSLMVALCDMLEPKKAWSELTEEKLVDLSENIIAQDFFDFVKTNKRFNLIIGNPPFNPPVDGKDKNEEKKKRDKYWNDITTTKVRLDFEIPDKNIALLFLQQAMKLLDKGGLLSLVIPSGPFLYNETLQHRRDFLEKYNVPQIIDFSSLTGALFEGRNYPVVVLFAQNVPPNDKDILHVAIRRTKTAKEKLFFEIDKYDLYYVPKELAKQEQLIWKSNLLGSGHLYYLLKRIQGLRTLEDYLKGKESFCNWKYGEGYQCFAQSTEAPQKAPYLTGKRMIPTDKFVGDFINKKDIAIEKDKVFHRPRNENIFKGPHILIKETPALHVAFTDDNLGFKNEIMGIHAPSEQKKELIRLRKHIIENRRLYKMHSLSGSGRAGISRSIGTILEKDILALPYPEDLSKLRLSDAEKMICDDVIEYYAEQLAKNEEAVVNIKTASWQTVKTFARVFCDSLNSIYKEKGKQFYPLEHVESASFICLPLAYGDPENPKKLLEKEQKQIKGGNLQILIDNKQGTNVLYKRIIKLYQPDMVYLVKPKILRYWLKSIALRDANEVFTDLVSSGY